MIASRYIEDIYNNIDGFICIVTKYNFNFNDLLLQTFALYLSMDKKITESLASAVLEAIQLRLVVLVVKDNCANSLNEIELLLKKFKVP